MADYEEPNLDLVVFPEDTPAVYKANVKYLANAVIANPYRTGINEAYADDTAQNVLLAAIALVENYAPNAPDIVKIEAVIRCAGWLVERPFASLDYQNLTFPSGTGAPLLHSSAKALLKPWRVHSAGVIG